jgi:predicted nucleic acid-binding protein
MIILDTNVLFELMRLRPEPEVLAWVDRQYGGELAVTAVNVAEILTGIAVLDDGAKKSALMDAAAMLFDQLFSGRVFSFDRIAAAEYAAIVAERRRQGSPISMADAQIAAVCRTADHILATRNTADFDRTGIELVNPWMD